METPGYFKLKEAAPMLGISPDALGEIVTRIGYQTESFGLPGRTRWLTTAQLEDIATRLGVELKLPEPASA